VIVFETLLVLVTGQLAIAGQFGREVHSWSVGLFLESKEQRWICLVLRSHDSTGGESFSLLPEVRLKGLFFHLPCTVAFAVSFPVAVIDGHR